jgi:hypothetical protein
VAVGFQLAWGTVFAPTVGEMENLKAKNAIVVSVQEFALLVKGSG